MEPRLKEVLAVVNNKGGVGKTTTVQSLAAAIVRNNKKARVLVIDMDPQCHLSLLAGWDLDKAALKGVRPGLPSVYDALSYIAPLPVYKTIRDGVYLSPSSPDLEGVDLDLQHQKNYDPREILARCIEQPFNDQTGEGLTSVFEDFDYVLIDCPPALSLSTYNAMTAATGMLVPTQLTALSTNGLGNIIVAMGIIQKRLNKNLELKGILPTMTNLRLRKSRGCLEYLKESYPEHVCNTVIRECSKMDEAQNYMKDIYKYKQWSTVANDYDALAKELFN